jgi:hypothetical protein
LRRASELIRERTESPIALGPTTEVAYELAEEIATPTRRFEGEITGGWQKAAPFFGWLGVTGRVFRRGVPDPPALN